MLLLLNNRIIVNIHKAKEKEKKIPNMRIYVCFNKWLIVRQSTNQQQPLTKQRIFCK